jgi:hypothetical protein
MMNRRFSNSVETFLMLSARAYSQSDCPSGCLVVLSALPANAATEGLRADLAQKRESKTRDLAEQLMRGVASGEIPSDTGVSAIARFYVTVQQGVSIQARDGVNHQTLESIARSAISAWDALVAASR